MSALFTIEIVPIPKTDRVHIVLAYADTGAPLACGAGPQELLALPGRKFINLASRVECDHGGTYRDPESLWRA